MEYFWEEISTKIDKSWRNFFNNYFGIKKLNKILEEIKIEWKKKKCYPEFNNIFRIFQEISLEKIKVVIIGQDPYYQEKVADGIAFSTEKENYIPASLKNIFIELKEDLKCKNKRENGSLLGWVKEGVFLINTSLTVRENEPLSHSKIWESFTHELLYYINNYNKNLVWIIWGKEAKNLRKKCGIDDNNCIESSHPSPFSANYGFFRSKPFSKSNQKLKELGEKEINWC